ncbi:MAG: 50S ribosome-binding GTPase, partial [Desulfobacteraceae bacterium]|nr:50S ribosome-binding GTPase [Desulfobacteraceae bacterium]
MTSEPMGVPEFAVLGHPNEGKSSVVSTLAEDDQIRVSPVPGETTVCRTYTVTMDGQDIIRFV